MIFIRCHQAFDQGIHINLGPDLVLAVTLFPKRTQAEEYIPRSEVLKQYANYNLTFGPKPQCSALMM